MARHLLRPNMPWYTEMVIMAVLSGLGVLYMNYASNDRVDAQRITAVETKQASETEKVNHIQDRVDKIYDKLLEWEKK